MKKFSIFLLMIILPMTAFASEIEAPTTLFIEKYVSILKRFEVLGSSDKKSPYGYIITALQTQLNAGGKKFEAAQSPAQADYYVVLLDIPLTYHEKERHPDIKFYVPDLDPELPQNKHAGGDGITPYRFVSPWMRGTLYIKDGKAVGGTIILPISRFAQIDELYHAAHQDWVAVTARNSKVLDEMSIPNSLFVSTLELYGELFSYGKATDNRLVEIFSSKGKAALALARSARIAGYSIHGLAARSLNRGLEKCLKYSEVFYTHLYEHLFTQLFTRTTSMTDDKIFHDISPSSEILQSIHDTSGNYNCFSPTFKETAP